MFSVLKELIHVFIIITIILFPLEILNFAFLAIAFIGIIFNPVNLCFQSK